MLVRVFAVNCIAASYTYFQTQCKRHQSNDKSVLDYLPQRTTTRQVLQITPHAEPGVSTPSSWRRSPALLHVLYLDCTPPITLRVFQNTGLSFDSPHSSPHVYQNTPTNVSSCPSLRLRKLTTSKGNQNQIKTHYPTDPVPSSLQPTHRELHPAYHASACALSSPTKLTAVSQNTTTSCHPSPSALPWRTALVVELAFCACAISGVADVVEWAG